MTPPTSQHPFRRMAAILAHPPRRTWSRLHHNEDMPPNSSPPIPPISIPPTDGRVAGILLTGGRSRRMGNDKAQLVIDGERLADRVAAELAAATWPVVEVGPGYTTLQVTREDPIGQGPLAAIACGWATVHGPAPSGNIAAVRAAITLAVDLPLATTALLRLIAEYPSPVSVVPIVDGRPQPLCARWSAEALHRATQLVSDGERSMRALLAAVEIEWLGPSQWGSVATADCFADLDTPDDLARLGLTRRHPPNTRPVGGPSGKTKISKDKDLEGQTSTSREESVAHDK